MRIVFDNPAILGDDFAGNKRQIQEMEVVTIAFNLKADRRTGEANVSITLECPDTGHQVHHLYKDKTTVPDMWNQVRQLEINGDKWVAKLIERLILDGKIPAGKIKN